MAEKGFDEKYDLTATNEEISMQPALSEEAVQKKQDIAALKGGVAVSNRSVVPVPIAAALQIISSANSNCSSSSDGNIDVNINIAESAAPRRLLLIRHGHTKCFETGFATRDDPLSTTGKAQAAHVATSCAQSMSEVNTVLVSPLCRALETALIIFGKRADVTLHVHPLLREFNLNQKERDVLESKYPRHVGSLKADLQARFPASQYSCRVVWDELPEGEWWEPHGDAFKLSTFFPARFPPSKDCDDSNAPSCTDRCKQLLAAIHGGAFPCSGPLALVAHENVFRVIAGLPRLSTAGCIGASLHASPLRGTLGSLFVHTDPLVHSPRAVFVPSDPSSGPACPAVRHAFVILGCADKSVYSARAATAYAAAIKLGGEAPLLLSVNSPAELFPAMEDLNQRVKDGILPANSLALFDMESATTEDNARRAIAHLSALCSLGRGGSSYRWVVHVCTSDWHMPRSLAVFWKEAEKMKGLLAIRALPSPVTWLALARKEVMSKHLLDSKHHLWCFNGSGSSDALRRRMITLGGMDSLLAVGRNLRVYERYREDAHSPAPGIREALLAAVRKGRGTATEATKAGARQEVHTLLERLYYAEKGGIVAPSLSIFKNGSTLLHFAASYGMEEMCLDLCILWGHAAYATNNEGKQPADFAKCGGHMNLAQTLQDIAATQLLQDACRIVDL